MGSEPYFFFLQISVLPQCSNEAVLTRGQNHMLSSQTDKIIQTLTLKELITTAADDIHKYFFHCFTEKIRLDVSSEASALQRLHLKHQALFSSKDTSIN